MTSVHTPLKPISNGGPSSATLPAQLPPPIQMLPEKKTASPARSCIRCRGALPPHSFIKWCELCRQKQVKQGFAVRLGAQGAPVFVPVLVNAVTAARQVATSSRVDTNVTITMVDVEAAVGGPSTSSSASPASKSNPGAMKRKADAMDSEAVAGRDQPCSAPAVHREYQNGRGLFVGLSAVVEASRASRSSSSRPQYVNFHGSYTIVMDPSVRGESRVKGLVDELELSGKLRFGNLVKRESEKSCGGYARTFWCVCDPQSPKQSAPLATQDVSPSATPASSQAGAPSKRSQSTLVGWLAKSQSKEKLDDGAPPLPPPGCGGTITVSAVSDFSHPLGRMGIEGQKMTVRVEHPGRDFKRPLEW